MALVECPECQSSISDSAKSCPSCGFVSYKRAMKKNVKYVKVAIALGFLALAGAWHVFITVTREWEQVKAQETIDEVEAEIAKGLEKFGTTISRYPAELAKMQAAIADMNESQQGGAQSLLQQLRKAMGSSNVTAMRQENEVGLTNILIASLQDATFGGNREEKLRMRGAEMSILREATTGAPLADVAKKIITLQFRDKALRQIAVGEDPTKTDGSDYDFRLANREAIKAIIASDEDIIRQRELMIVAGFSLADTERELYRMAIEKVKVMEKEAEQPSSLINYKIPTIPK